jgi:hypothetical protein
LLTIVGLGQWLFPVICNPSFEFIIHFRLKFVASWFLAIGIKQNFACFLLYILLYLVLRTCLVLPLAPVYNNRCRWDICSILALFLVAYVWLWWKWVYCHSVSTLKIFDVHFGGRQVEALC